MANIIIIILMGEGLGLSQCLFEYQTFAESKIPFLTFATVWLLR